MSECTCTALEYVTHTPARGCPEHWVGSLDPQSSIEPSIEQISRDEDSGLDWFDVNRE